MISLDMRTVIFSYVITDLVSTLVLLFVWYQNHKYFEGITLWLFDFVLQTTALILIISRSFVPELLSMVVSNTMVIVGGILGLKGLERFAGLKIRNTHNYILLAVFVIIHTWFTLVHPDLSARSLNISVAMLILFIQYIWVALKRVSNKIRKQTGIVGVVFIGFSLVSVVRIVQFFHNRNSASDYFNSGEFETAVMIIYQMLFILLTYSLVLMFNKRLYIDLALQEEKFSKAFHNSINSITLSRLSDGKLIEVNYGFLKITGYQYTEVLGKTVFDFHFWDKEEERILMVEELLRTGKMSEKEYKFRKKNGEIFTGLLSAGIITINDENYILSNINDITQTRMAEASLKEANAIFMAAMDCSQAGIAIADAPSGKLRYVNKAGLMIPDKPENELVTEVDIDKYVSSWHIKHHDGTSYKPDEVPLARAILYGETNSREFVISRDNEDDRIVLANAAPILDDSKKVIAGIVVFLDITERKKAEDALRRNEEKTRKMFELLPVGVSIIDEQLNVIEQNDALNRIIKLDKDEISGGKYNKRKYFNGDGTEMNKKEFPSLQVLAGQKEILDKEIGILIEEREIIWTSVSAALIPGIGAIIVTKDITDHKLAQRSLFEKMEELEKFNKIMVGREKRMVELKREVNELCEKMNIPPKYKSPVEVKNK
jgi:PAS domain S-box-containing protein